MWISNIYKSLCNHSNTRNISAIPLNSDISELYNFRVRLNTDQIHEKKKAIVSPFHVSGPKVVNTSKWTLNSLEALNIKVSSVSSFEKLRGLKVDNDIPLDVKKLCCETIEPNETNELLIAFHTQLASMNPDKAPNEAHMYITRLLLLLCGLGLDGLNLTDKTSTANKIQSQFQIKNSKGEDVNNITFKANVKYLISRPTYNILHSAEGMCTASAEVKRDENFPANVIGESFALAARNFKSGVKPVASHLSVDSICIQNLRAIILSCYFPITFIKDMIIGKTPTTAATVKLFETNATLATSRDDVVKYFYTLAQHYKKG